MRKAILLFLAALLATPILAQEVPSDDLPSLAELKWVARPVVIFADSPNDPRLLLQLRNLDSQKDDLDQRDVVILVDTDASANSELRQKFRPRDFTVLVLGKDGEVKYRKPKPVSVGEVIRLIDRLPLRREEMESRRSGTEG